jgi:hypothetical protein
MMFVRTQAISEGKDPVEYAEAMLRERFGTDELTKMLETAGGDPIEALAFILLEDLKKEHVSEDDEDL